MPNHITNKLIFDKTHKQKVFDLACTGEKFDFHLLIPRPLYIYVSDTSGEDEEYFGEFTWDKWNRKYWGTKWNCYHQSNGEIDNDLFFVQFDTAWSIPKPIITAFANKMEFNFTHKYIDEGFNFWGVDSWFINRGSMGRRNLNFNNEENKLELSIELLGYDFREDQ